MRDAQPLRRRLQWGLAALAGIGFTVSLFIADLAYDQAALTDTAKIGILAGSATAALIGAAILFPGRHPRAPKRRTPRGHNVSPRSKQAARQDAPPQPDMPGAG